jgi:RNA polymerase sigma-70 factor (ECF subfamily)
MSDDLPVIKRVIDGDVESFRLLVQRYERPLFCLVKNLLPDPQDGDDIAQEVFLAAYRNLAAYNPRRSAFSTWLFTIARNKCFSALKKKKPVALAEVPEAADPRTPEGEAAGNELFRQLDAALASLPFEQKTVFLLAEIQGLSHEEIGRIEGVKPGTVKSRLSRAKDKLRVLLRPTVEFP